MEAVIKAAVRFIVCLWFGGCCQQLRGGEREGRDRREGGRERREGGREREEREGEMIIIGQNGCRDSAVKNCAITY